MRAIVLALALASMALMVQGMLVSDRPVIVCIAAVAGLTGLAVYWVRGYQRAHFPLAGEPFEVLIIFSAGMAVDHKAFLLPLFALLFRSLYGGAWLALARVAAYGLGLEVVNALGDAMGRDEVMSRHVGQLLAAAVLQALAGALQRQEAGEEALRLYRGVKDHAMLRLDAAGRVASWDVGAERVLGYRRADALGHHIDELIEPDYPLESDTSRDLARAAGEGSAQSAGTRVCKGGRAIFADVVTTALHDEQGRLDGFLVLVRDVTARHLAAEALRESRERLRAVVQGSPITLWATDADGVCTLYEGGLAAVARGKIVGRRADDLLGGQPELLGVVQRALVGQPGGCTVDFGPTVADCRCVPLRDDAGQITGVIGVGTDITERARAQAESEQLQHALVQSQRLESVGRLAGGVAHDFNNLLAVILSYAEVVVDQLPAGDQVAEDVDEIRKAAERAAALTQQLLVFSKRQVVNTEQMNLNDALDDMEKLLRRALGSGLELVTAFERPLLSVEADPTRVEQVLMNLAVNARDAMPQGGVLTIETANVVLGPTDPRPGDLRPGSYVRLTVRDTGVGMPADVVEHAFDPFFTTKGKAGTGLGLATVYGIVTQAGGHIRIDSTPGAGTAFEVHLPALATASEQPEPAGTRKFLRGAGQRILIVEDEQGIAETTRRTLEQGGYQAVVAPTAAEAIEIVQRGEPVDLVLSDVVMPGIAGPALAARMAELRPGIEVIFMSGQVDGVVDVEGSSPLLAKPFTGETLLARVGTALASAAERVRSAA